MTMNPHTTATGLRAERQTALKARNVGEGAGPSRHAKAFPFGPAALLSAAFIVVVSHIAKVFYE